MTGYRSYDATLFGMARMQIAASVGAINALLEHAGDADHDPRILRLRMQDYANRLEEIALDLERDICGAYNAMHMLEDEAAAQWKEVIEDKHEALEQAQEGMRAALRQLLS